MANTFKVVNFAAEPNSAGTPFTMYTVASSTTTVVLGLILANIHTTAVTATDILIFLKGLHSKPLFFWTRQILMIFLDWGSCHLSENSSGLCLAAS